MAYDLDRQAVCVVAFARTPAIGKVKKRLAKTVGEVVAYKIYEELFQITLGAVEMAAERSSLLVGELRYHGNTPTSEQLGFFKGLKNPQTHSDMILNLTEALNGPLDAGFRGALVLGADHPLITSDHIQALAELLETYPVAIGPTQDGGFWGFATTVKVDNILKNVAMSTDRAFETLLSACHDQGCKCGIGPKLWDIDNEADLLRWKNFQDN